MLAVGGVQVERVVWLDPKKDIHSRERRKGLNKGKEKRQEAILVGKDQRSGFQKRRGSRDQMQGKRDRELGAIQWPNFTEATKSSMGVSPTPHSSFPGSLLTLEKSRT